VAPFHPIGMAPFGPIEVAPFDPIRVAPFGRYNQQLLSTTSERGRD